MTSSNPNLPNIQKAPRIYFQMRGAYSFLVSE